MPEQVQSLGFVVLEGLVRLIGALWVFGTVFLWLALWQKAKLAGLMADASRIVDEIRDEIGDQDDPVMDEANARATAWALRDGRRQRRWLAIQGGLLMATGLSMVFYHVSAAGLIAALIAAQGVYFLWRERVARTAPSEADAADARPEPSTVRAGWFSLMAGGLIWTAAAMGRLGGTAPWS